MRLTPFNLTQNISVDNALSTIQVIHQIITKVNNVVDYVNNLEVNANTYTDEHIKALNEKIEKELFELETTLKTYSDNINNNMKKYVDDRDKFIIDLLYSSMETVKEYIDNIDKTLRLYIDTEDSKIYVYIDEIYKELYDLIMNGNDIIYSPVDGFLKSTKDVIQDLTHVLQLKNGINWNTFELLCNGEIDTTNWVKIANDRNYYYDSTTDATIMNITDSGIYLTVGGGIDNATCNGSSNNLSIMGSGLLVDLNALTKEFNEVVISWGDNTTIVNVKNGNMTPAKVTWNSLEKRLNEQPNVRYGNWNSLSFYTVAFVNVNLMRTDGTLTGVLPETMMTTEFNKEFFGGI